MWPLVRITHTTRACLLQWVGLDVARVYVTPTYPSPLPPPPPGADIALLMVGDHSSVSRVYMSKPMCELFSRYGPSVDFPIFAPTCLQASRYQAFFFVKFWEVPVILSHSKLGISITSGKKGL